MFFLIWNFLETYFDSNAKIFFFLDKKCLEKHQTSIRTTTFAHAKSPLYWSACSTHYTLTFFFFFTNEAENNFAFQREFFNEREKKRSPPWGWNLLGRLGHEQTRREEQFLGFEKHVYPVKDCWASNLTIHQFCVSIFFLSLFFFFSISSNGQFMDFHA